MNALITKIERIELARRKEKLLRGLDVACVIISSDVNQQHKAFLKEDFEVFKTDKRWIVHNTFAGGIIFLREPEVIERIWIEINTDTNAAFVSVEYSSSVRNSRNVKYKPDAGKIESTEWNMLWLFPHFNEYKREIQIALMTLIGNFVKTICEDLNQDSWFMKYTKNFDLELFLDDELVNTFSIESIGVP